MKNSDVLLARYEFFVKALTKYFGDDSVEKFTNDYKESLAICPRSLYEDQGGQPGDLIDYLCNSAILAKKICSAFEESTGISISDDEMNSISRVLLIHEIGKLGTPENSLYLVQDSNWHHEKLKQSYKYNPNCPQMAVGHRTLFLCQKYGFELTSDEWLSILISQGIHIPENSFYAKNLSTVSKVVLFVKSMLE